MNHTSEIAALKRRNLELEERLAAIEAPAKAKAAAEAYEEAAAKRASKIDTVERDVHGAPVKLQETYEEWIARQSAEGVRRNAEAEAAVVERDKGLPPGYMRIGGLIRTRDGQIVKDPKVLDQIARGDFAGAMKHAHRHLIHADLPSPTTMVSEFDPFSDGAVSGE